MTVKTELLAIQRADPNRILRAEAVWGWAKANPQSSLYREIEWNVKKAAKEYQLWQIRRLISVHVVDERGDPQIINLTIDRVKPGGGYRAIGDVLKSRELSEVMLQDAIAELDRVKIKYERVEQLSSVWKEVDKVRSKSKKPGKKRSGRRLAA